MDSRCLPGRYDELETLGSIHFAAFQERVIAIVSAGSVDSAWQRSILQHHPQMHLAQASVMSRTSYLPATAMYRSTLSTVMSYLPNV